LQHFHANVKKLSAVSPSSVPITCTADAALDMNNFTINKHFTDASSGSPPLAQGQPLQLHEHSSRSAQTPLARCKSQASHVEHK